MNLELLRIMDLKIFINDAEVRELFADNGNFQDLDKK